MVTTRTIKAGRLAEKRAAVRGWLYPVLGEFLQLLARINGEFDG